MKLFAVSIFLGDTTKLTCTYRIKKVIGIVILKIRLKKAKVKAVFLLLQKAFYTQKKIRYVLRRV